MPMRKVPVSIWFNRNRPSGTPMRPGTTKRSSLSGRAKIDPRTIHNPCTPTSTDINATMATAVVGGSTTR